MDIHEWFLRLGWWGIRKVNSYLTGTGIAALVRVLETESPPRDDTSYFSAICGALPAKTTALSLRQYGNFFIRDGQLQFVHFFLRERLQSAITRRLGEINILGELKNAITTKDCCRLRVLLLACPDFEELESNSAISCELSTLLYLATKVGNGALVRTLFSTFPELNPNETGGHPDGKLPLMKAAQNNDVGILQLLLKHHANANLKDLHGNNALDWAVMDGGRINASVNILESYGGRW